MPTEFGYCPHCKDRKELVPNSAGTLQCHSCGAIDVYKNKKAYERARKE